MKIDHPEVTGFVQWQLASEGLGEVRNRNPVSCLLAPHYSHSVAVCQPHACFV